MSAVNLVGSSRSLAVDGRQSVNHSPHVGLPPPLIPRSPPVVPTGLMAPEASDI